MKNQEKSPETLTTKIIDAAISLGVSAAIGTAFVGWLIEIHNRASLNYKGPVNVPGIERVDVQHMCAVIRPESQQT